MSETLAWWAIGACLLMVPTIRSWAAANRRYAAAVERATAAVQATMSPAVAVQLAEATARAEAAEAEAERLRELLSREYDETTLPEMLRATGNGLDLRDKANLPAFGHFHRWARDIDAALGHETEETPDA